MAFELSDAESSIVIVGDVTAAIIPQERKKLPRP